VPGVPRVGPPHQIVHTPRQAIFLYAAEDPEVLQKPWTLSRTLTLQPDALEEAAPCVDKDAGHYVTQEHHDNTR
jgi:hypothetical protein